MLGYKRAWAKFRRISFFVVEAQQHYNMLIYDILSTYPDFYDFQGHSSEYPLIEDEEEAPKPVVGGDAETFIKEVEQLKSEQVEEPLTEVKSDKEEKIKRNFTIDYKYVNTEPFDFEVVDPITAHALPIFQLIKATHGLSKLYISRCKIDDSNRAITFASEAYSRVIGSKQTLHRARMCIDFSNQYLHMVDHNGESRYDSDDRPLAFAFEADSLIKTVFTDANNYWRAYSQDNLCKVYTAKD